MKCLICGENDAMLGWELCSFCEEEVLKREIALQRKKEQYERQQEELQEDEKDD